MGRRSESLGKRMLAKVGVLGVLLLTLPAAAFAERWSAAVAPVNSAIGALVAEAMDRNPEIRAARNEAEAARQRISPAGALDDPMLEAGVVNLPVPSASFAREDMTMKMLGLSQKLPYPGKRGLREEVASKDAQAVDYAYQETVNRVIRDVKVGYYDLALAIESQRLARENRQILEQFLQIAEARYQVGQGNQADVLKAQTQLSKTDDELIRLERERVTLEAELNRVLGRASSAVTTVAEMPRLEESPLDSDALRQAALDRRPQLLALQNLAERDSKAVELARKEYLPDFEVRFSYGQRDRTPAGLPRDDMVGLTVAVNLPVWGQKRIEPRIAEAIAMRNRAADMVQAQQNEVSAQLRQRVTDAEQSAKSARLYETAILPQARLTVEASIAAYKVGRVDLLTLLDSQMTVFNEELAHATAVATYSKARAEIELLTGQPQR